jgi:hypothetical protein
MMFYTIISHYTPFCRDAFSKFPFGRDWNILGNYDECYAAICGYLMRRYKTIEQFYEPMCLKWGATGETFFEYGDEFCEVNGERMEIMKVRL